MNFLTNTVGETGCSIRALRLVTRLGIEIEMGVMYTSPALNVCGKEGVTEECT